MYLACLLLSTFIFVAGAVYTCVSIAKKRKTSEMFERFSASVFAAATVMFLPIYHADLNTDGTAVKFVKTVLLSIHNAIRLFVVDGDFEIIKNSLQDAPGWLSSWFSVTAAVIFVVAPIITFGAVLSVVMSAFAYYRYRFSIGSEICVFSELNAKSVALAESIYKKDSSVKLVFNDVFDNNDEESSEMIAAARDLGAILFKKDVTAVNFFKHKKNKKISFFLIGEDDAENIAQMMYLVNTCHDREKTHVYLFSTSPESELLLSSIDRGEVKLRRINDVESLIFRTLYEDGAALFDNARQKDGVKKISAVLVGLGRYGTEMLKTLAWFCQMDGYFIEINAFDANPHSESAFRSRCPELLDERFNRFEITDEDARYLIRITGDMDVNSYEFDKHIKELSDTTYVFVALGSDELNIRVAAKLRQLYESVGIHPQIQAVVYNSQKKHTLNGVTNFKGQKLDIDFIGDIESSYSESVVLDSDVERQALQRHMKWGDEKSFWNYEYNYRSSIASVIHGKMKRYCRIPGADKPVAARTQAEKEILRRLEHRRWNAYTRGEGYTYAPQRNDLAKQHHDLVPFSALSEKERTKDDN